MSSDDEQIQTTDETDEVIAAEEEVAVKKVKQKAVESGWANFPHTLESLKDGNPDAWSAFITRQNEVAENLIAARFSRGRVSIEDAQDMAAELYVKLRKNIADMRTLEGVGQWFVTALNHDALDLIGKKKAVIHGGGNIDSINTTNRKEAKGKHERATEYTNAYHQLHDKNFDWEITERVLKQMNAHGLLRPKTSGSSTGADKLKYSYLVQILKKESPKLKSLISMEVSVVNRQQIENILMEEKLLDAEKKVTGFGRRFMEEFEQSQKQE